MAERRQVMPKITDEKIAELRVTRENIELRYKLQDAREALRLLALKYEASQSALRIEQQSRTELLKRAESAEPALTTIFCDAHRPNASRTYNGCLVCSRNEDAAMVEEFLKSLGWAHDEEAELNLHGWQWYCIGEEERGTWDTQTAFTKAMEDYDALRDAHKKARLALAQSERALAEARQGWIPVSERLPERSGEYITSQSHGALVCVMYFHADHASGPRFHFDGVTHWRPLPTPPETTTKEQP